MILVIAGTLAGIIPARRAVSISPVDALRADRLGAYGFEIQGRTARPIGPVSAAPA